MALRAIFLALILEAAFGGALGCSGQAHSCTLLGCTDGVSLTGTVAKGGSALAIKVCMNGQCESGTANVASSTANNCSTVGTSSASSICFSTTPGADTWTVTGFLTISDAQTGAILGSADAHVNYSSQYPNGPDCGPACHKGELAVSPS